MLGLAFGLPSLAVIYFLKTLLVFSHPQDLSLDQATEEDCQVAANEIQREYEAHMCTWMNMNNGADGINELASCHLWFPQPLQSILFGLVETFVS